MADGGWRMAEALGGWGHQRKPPTAKLPSAQPPSAQRLQLVEQFLHARRHFAAAAVADDAAVDLRDRHHALRCRRDERLVEIEQLRFAQRALVDGDAR